MTRHAKWAIPWMEDDPGLSAPELWVNRTLMHMEDSSKYGCDVRSAIGSSNEAFASVISGSTTDPGSFNFPGTAWHSLEDKADVPADHGHGAKVLVCSRKSHMQRGCSLIPAFRQEMSIAVVVFVMSCVRYIISRLFLDADFFCLGT